MPKLTDKEKSELLAAGKCFRCRETGHLSHNCPLGNTVKSDSNKPPGVSSFNMEISEEVVDETEELESLPFLSIFFNIDIQSGDEPDASIVNDGSSPVGTSSEEGELEWVSYNPRRRPHRHIGDCYRMMAEYILQGGQYYPGDEIIMFEQQRERFSVTNHSINDSLYQIRDQAADFEVDLPRELLREPFFRLVSWYG
ncbi:hypothetical protein BDQ17DRAFT_1244713 [Cyathus striatus]|nr:hypothetical protein BDQ17DRAFT_1244713 [Cyathus striatus]